MTLHQFLLVLRARYKIAIFIPLAVILAALAVTVLMGKTYTAQTSMLIDVRSPDPVAGAAMSGIVSPTYMATQVEVIKGEQVSRRVIKALKLDQDPQVKQDWLDATEGRGTQESWMVDSLQKKLEVRPSRESNVISITFKGNSPEAAANTANAFAQAYLDTNLSLKTEPARLYAEWFEEQTKTSRAKLEDAQSRLSNFQQKAGIVSSDERTDYETTKLAEISTQLTLVQGQTTDAQSKRGAGGGTVAEIMQSPLINSLKTDIGRMEAKLAELSVNLGVNHPDRQRAETDLAAARGRLSAETGRISQSIETAYRVGKDRERELQGSVAAQRSRVLGLNKQRDELNVYRRDVEAAQRAYEGVSQSASQTRLQSLTNQTNVVRLNTATAPLLPSSPKPLINLLIAAFGGTLLGVAFALLLELGNRRVRSAEDLVQILDLPVLASISSGSSHREPLPGPRRLAIGHGSAA